MKGKKILVIGVVIIFILLQCSILTLNVNAETINGSSEGINWNYDSETETLTFSGNGKITDSWKVNITKERVRKVIIENGTTSIEEHAFNNCTQLTTIEIPNSVTNIGNAAFSGCKKLTSIEIPSSVTSIGSSAFAKCKGLTGIEIPNGVTSIKGATFQECTGLTSIKIPNSITSIGDYAFVMCTGLTSIEIPNSVTSIGKNAFYGCKELVNVKIPNNVTNLESSAFLYCEKITSIEVDDNNDKYCSLDGIVYDKNKTTIVCYPSGRKGNYKILSNITKIENEAFKGCKELTGIEIPDSVTSIGDSAFDDCIGLTIVEIPNNVTSIGSFAFSNCTGITKIIIPSSVTSTRTIFNNFSGTIYCRSNSTIKQYAEENNILFVTDDTAPVITSATQNNEYIKIIATDNTGVGLSNKAYSLDNKNWFANNEIKIEKGGEYTIYVRDKLDNIATDTINVIIAETNNENNQNKEETKDNTIKYEQIQNDDKNNTKIEGNAKQEYKNEKTDKTTANKPLSQTGNSFILTGVVIVSIMACMVFYKKNKSLNWK